MRLSKLIWVIIGVSIIGTLVVYPSLPEQIPIHWNTAGQVDNYGGKVTALVTAFLPVVMALLLYFLPKIDPKRESYKKHGKAYTIFASLLIVFFILIHWTATLAALDYNVNVGMITAVSVGILFLGIGNYMGQIRHNYFFGIRTPWTLASEEVWVKTHRMGSWFFLAVGVLFIITAFINHDLGFKVTITFLLASVVFLYAYSYYEFKRVKN